MQALPESLGASPLVAGGGWLRTRLLSPRALSALAQESAGCHAATGEVVRLDRSPDEDVTRGNPARYMESAPGGPRLRAFYYAPPLLALLRRLTTLDWTPSGDHAAFSYYLRPGHHLDLHRDIDACDLAVITCIHEAGAPAGGVAGALCLWPGRTGERLAAIRAHPSEGRVVVRLRPGESVVLLGGLIPHRLEPVAEGHVRVVAPLCFRARQSLGPSAASATIEASMSHSTGAWSSV